MEKMDDGEKFSKPICSICFEDLKSVAEDLQAIFICGHVFHEHCLQQLFEYCLNSNNFACPVCNQQCKTTDTSHLYSQSLRDSDEDPKKLREEVRRLQSKVEGLGSALESQGKNFKEIAEQLSISKAQQMREVALTNEILKKNVSLQQLLRSKSEELDKSGLALANRNKTLAKELATIKMSYKDLMAKHNLLERQSRSSEKLYKAQKTICKLKARIKEMEKAGEEKDNDALRELKDDGRGGRVKVPRSLNQSSMDFKETSEAKRFKSGGKTNGMQSPGPSKGLT